MSSGSTCLKQHAEVAVYPVRALHSRHHRESLLELARRIAILMRVPLAGILDPRLPPQGSCYLVPSDSIIGATHARDLGILTEGDFFGGVVPHAFVATKAITHRAAGDAGHAPDGWSMDFARRVHDATLRGASVFTLDDARRVAAQMLQAGPVRIKPVLATAGRGQVLAQTLAQVDDALAIQDSADVARVGLVLEENLEDVTTHSVGQVTVAGIVTSYFGTQTLTRDQHGTQIYGGSQLNFVRGGFDALLACELPENVAQAIDQARIYDAAAMACFPGLLASRRNYDIAQGRDANGRRRSGVLEQSWRAGGASSAEIVAIEAFHADPGLHVIGADSVELHGDGHEVPPGAAVFFRGMDEELGFLTKFACLRPYGNT